VNNNVVSIPPNYPPATSTRPAHPHQTAKSLYVSEDFRSTQRKSKPTARKTRLFNPNCNVELESVTMRSPSVPVIHTYS
jgi:hypothetical protein